MADENVVVEINRAWRMELIFRSKVCTMTDVRNTLIKRQARNGELRDQRLHPSNQVTGSRWQCSAYVTACARTIS